MSDIKNADGSMNKFVYGQDVLKYPGGSASAGFNRRVGGSSYNECCRHESELQDRELYAGWNLADEMIRQGKLFYVHNFHQMECDGLAFQYGGSFVCNTCNRDHLDKEWWKIKVSKDGSAWCCVGNGFENLQESDNYAFGDTRDEAIKNYGELMLSKAQGGNLIVIGG